MGDTSNAKARREKEGFFSKYIVGRGIDIGCGGDPLTPTCDRWDVLDGDAQFMEGVASASYTWVYSSHCLEHMVDPGVAIRRWWELVQPGGHLIIVVPDFDLYEQGMWPSRFNTDHKSTWSVDKLQQEFEALPGGLIEYVVLRDAGYDRSLKKALIGQVIVKDRDLAVQMEVGKVLNAAVLGDWELRCLGFWPVDQTACPFYAEASVEGIVRKA